MGSESTVGTNSGRQEPTDGQIQSQGTPFENFPLIVGIGASAGGLEAFKTFFANMPIDCGMAFVLVQHLAPDHASMLVELLRRATKMTVSEAADGMAVAANQVFVIPPNATLTIEAGILHLVKPAPPRVTRRPIDTFFLSLAADQGENAVSIVLSGTGSDGAVGVTAIKENGGFTMAQAEFDHSAMGGMPHSAVATGFVDQVLPAEEMPARLISYQQHLRNVASRKEADGTRADTAEHLATIARLLRLRVGHDFTHYKAKTVVRRIQRRMQVLQIDSVPDFITHLKANPHELDLLFRELLISVTQFFRDPEAFEALQTEVIARLLKGKGADDTIRVWVPGCATGEEVYSIAILLREAIAQHSSNPKIQIFGTDIDDRAVAFARTGCFDKTTGLSPERVTRWFAEDGNKFRPVKEIREMCVFSLQSVVKDPPFSKLDLISCRNLLIYMDVSLQDRVLPTFHYALNSNGFLFLGPSESVSRQSKYFAPIDKKHRIFQRLDVVAVLPELSSPSIGPRAPSKQKPMPVAAPQEDQILRKVRQQMEKYSPAYLVIDNNFEILRFSGGEIGRYLEPISGTASLNLFAILRKALRPIVREAVRTADVTKKPVVQDSVAIKVDGRYQTTTVIVEPVVGEAESGFCVVAFRDSGTDDHDARAAAGESHDSGSPAVEDELRTVRTQLQSSIDELETANEEMRSTSEEYQSVNEELQSANEELETSKEEMQSINEELQTINSEMMAKNEALGRLNSDIKNLLASTEIATLFLDAELRIKSFTQPMTDIFHLREGDRGRPITEIVTMLDYPSLQRDVTEVMRKLSVIEREVKLDDHAMTFILRIRPYRTMDNVIDGVVMTFVDITERKQQDDKTSLLLGELDHRVKNILSIISSVITQTLKTSETPEAFKANMERRIAAIARAHNLLTHEGGRSGASLRSLIDRELAPYNRENGNLEISGPAVFLTPKSGLTLAMAIHELSSNASKYGALSTAEGRLAVSWKCFTDAKGVKLNIVWLETGGPPVERPRRAGFGTTLIECTVGHDLDGEVTREFLSSGVRCTIEIPLTADVGYLLPTSQNGGKPREGP